jgi:hypothetical protein
MATPFVGTNVDHAGEYSVAREELGPNAQNLYSNLILTDFDARYCNRDVLYSGTPNVALSTRTNIICQRIHGHDAGRAFITVVVGKNITVDVFKAEEVAHTMCNLEPSSSSAVIENIQMKHGEVGRCGYFMFSSKGNVLRPVTATFEDIVTLPNKTQGNLFWAHSLPVGYDGNPANALKKFTLRRVDSRVRGDISDLPKFTDNYGVPNTMTRQFEKAIMAPNCALYLEDVWVNGKKITLNDIAWQWTDSKGATRGVEPQLVFTGWEPGDIEPPPDPEPMPDPELERLRIENVLLALDRDAKQAEIVRLDGVNDSLELKIANAKAALA